MTELSPSEPGPEGAPFADPHEPLAVGRPETRALPGPAPAKKPPDDTSGGEGGRRDREGGEHDRPEPPPQPERDEILSDDTATADSFQDKMKADAHERDLREESLRDLHANRTRVKGDWNTVWNAGGDIHVNTDDQKSRVQCPRISMDEAHAIITCATGVEKTVGQVVDMFRRHRVVLLQGRPGSGRMTTGKLALLHADPEEYNRVLVTGDRRDQTVRVARLLILDEPLELRREDLDGGVGYVLDATDEVPRRRAANVIAHLEDIAADCRIVVLVGNDCRLDGRTVDQVMPDPEKVFVNHLEYMLGSVMRDPSIWVDKIRGAPELNDALRELTPQMAFTTAWEVNRAYQDHGPGEDIEVYLAGLDALLLADVREMLRDDGPETLRKRCFVIAAAVLNTLSAVTVSRATLDLVALVEGRGQDDAAATTPSWEQLTDWLAHARATAPPAAARGEGRFVRLNRSAQAHATLEVVWEEHPTVREVLSTWLERLSEHPDQAVRIKAAHAVGTLATFDFGVIEREFLRPWAKSRRVSHHQLASWVLEAAVTYDGITDRVRKLLRRWAKGTRTQQSVAASAYGSAIGTLWLEDTLNAFEAISKVVGPRRLQDAVARSLADLFGDDREMRILETLHQWSADPYPSQRRTAALTFNRLTTRLESEQGRTGMADLLRHTDPRLLEFMTGLWWNALSAGMMPTLRRSLRRADDNAAWEILADWLSHEATHPVLSPVIDGVFDLSREDGDLGREYGDLKCPLYLHLRWWFHREDKIIERERAQRLARLLETN